MKSKAVLGLLLFCCALGATAEAAQPAPSCDRECLRGKVTQELYAMLKHDASGLPVADKLRVTEDAVEKPLANVGLLRTVTRLRGYRQDILDERGDQLTVWEAFKVYDCKIHAVEAFMKILPVELRNGGWQ